jgi:hypothetical protein
MRARRFIAGLLVATGAGLAFWSLPVGFVETVVASSGISEALPAAAPPLGMKARLVVAGFGALMALGLFTASRGRTGVLTLTHDKQGRDESASGVSKMGFALSKLGWLSRNRGESSRTRGPALRRADAHPDNPARTPIFASRDFGGLDIFARTAPGREEAEPVIEEVAAPLSGPVQEPTEPFAPLGRAFAEEEGAFETPVASDAGVVSPQPPARAPLGEHLSIADLTARLEQGLAQRKRIARPASVLADMPVQPAVPVRDHVEQDTDEALRLALNTLRSMTGRAR